MLKNHENTKDSYFPFESKLFYLHLKKHLSQTQSTDETEEGAIRSSESKEIYIVEKNLENCISVADNIAECFQTSPKVSLKHKRVDNIGKST